MKKVREKDITQNPFHKRAVELEKLEAAIADITREIKAVDGTFTTMRSGRDYYYDETKEMLVELRKKYAELYEEYEYRRAAFNWDLNGGAPVGEDDPSRYDTNGDLLTDDDDEDGDEDQRSVYYEHFPEDDEEFDDLD